MTASHDTALIEHAAAIIEAEARNLRECSTTGPDHTDWGDEFGALDVYNAHMGVAGQLRDLAARYRAMPASHTEREERLDGATYKVKAMLSERVEKFYLTINDQNGRPFEIFLKTDTPPLIEWMFVTSWAVSKLMQYGMTPSEIADALRAMHSGGHSRHVLKDGSQCFSLVERIGREITNHLAKYSKGATHDHPRQ